MARGKYGFQMLSRHSNHLALESRKLFKSENNTIERTFSVLDELFAYLQRQPSNLARNVKLVLLTRFINHLLAAHILLERGLILDVHNLFRSALETTAFYWLICLQPQSAEQIVAPTSPRPVEIRKRIEQLGGDLAGLKAEYGFLSEVGHVGNPTEHIQLDWQSPKNAKLLVGGARNIEVERHLLKHVPNMVGRFIFYEPAFKDNDFRYRIDTK
jgi:hypothetical protein